MNERIKEKYIYILPLSITVILLVLKLCRFLVIDDVLMNDIAESFTFNEHSEFLGFVSVILGYILKAFYLVFPYVNWYSAFHILLITIDFIVLHSIFKDYKNRFIAIIILTIAQFYFLVSISFTTVSFLSVVSGTLYILSNVEQIDKKSIKFISLGVLLIFSAFLLRRGTILYGIILILIPLMFDNALKNKKKLIVSVFVLISVLASNYLLLFVQNEYKKSIPEESYYSEFQQYRSAASDNGIINYTENSEKYEEAGLSKNDCRLFTHYLYADKTVYSAQTLKTIVENRGIKDKYIINPFELIKEIVNAKSIFTALILLTVTALFYLFFAKTKRLTLLFSYALCAASIAYLFFRRRAIPRICIPIIVCGIILITYVFVKNNAFQFKRTKSVSDRFKAGLLLLIIISSFTVSYFIQLPYKMYYDNMQVVSEYLRDNNESVYISDPLSFDVFKVKNRSLNILKPFNNEINSNSVLGDWYVYSYYWYGYMDELGLNEYADNAFMALLDSRVEFATQYVEPEWITQYFSENYNIDVEYVVVKEFPEQNVVIYDFNLK